MTIQNLGISKPDWIVQKHYPKYDLIKNFRLNTEYALMILDDYVTAIFKIKPKKAA